MFARTFKRVVVPPMKQSVRRMGGHHAPPPTEGFEGAVRKVLPHDHQVVLAIIGFYATLGLVAKLWPSSKKAPVVAAAPVAAASTGDVPSIDSPEFDAWISTPGNLEKLLQE